ncbi:MAG: ATP-binding protein [Bacilli bacterium]|nr:ATP-binding protein [Bacilli bacterium]
MVEKLKVKNMNVQSDDVLIEQMKEALHACPSAMKFLRDQGMNDEVMEQNITKIYDFVRDVNYCRKCPGIKQCKKDNAYVISKVTYSYGVVENQLIPCPEILKRVTFERQFLVKDFSDEWLDVVMGDIDKSKEKTAAMENYMKYLRNEEYHWLYLTGGIGSGKSYFAAAMSIDLAKRDLKGKCPICFINASKRFLELSDLNKQKSDEFKKKLELYSTVPVLVIDDFGHEFKNDFIRDAIVNEIISTRCNKKLLTIFTSNFSLDEIEVLYSTTNAGAIMAKQIVRTIRAMCKNEINLGDLKIY